MTRVILIEDDTTLRQVLTNELRQSGFNVSSFATAGEALQQIDSDPAPPLPDVCLVDLHLPGMSGLEFLRELQRRDAALQVVMLTGKGGVNDAVESMKSGAYDFVVKPASLERLEVTLLKAAEKTRLLARHVAWRLVTPRELADSRLLGESAAILELRSQIECWAARTEPLLIEGEPGVGKQLVARAVHRASARSEAAFVVLDASRLALDDQHDAWLGNAERPGPLWAALSGTLYIANVEQLATELQLKLYARLVDTDSAVRVIGSSSRSLRACVSEGTVDPALMRWLMQGWLPVPALREHAEDIPLLIAEFARQARPAEAQLVFTPAALRRMQSHTWPGNVSELKNAVRRLAASTRSGVVDLPDVERSAFVESCESAPELPTLRLSELERRALMRALELTGGDKRAAADTLGVSLRTLYNMLDRHGLKERYAKHGSD
jgi:DNA-binding NtrC family response regulator